VLSKQSSKAAAQLKPYIIYGFLAAEPQGHLVSTLPACPKCNSEFTYEDGAMLICSECAHEWSASETAEAASDDSRVIKDSVGNVLQDGDTITVIKDLKVKGTSLVVKVGMKVKNIRLCDGDHDIDCKIDGIGAMKLKSEFVRKV
jgi:protein PhnA